MTTSTRPGLADFNGPESPRSAYAGQPTPDSYALVREVTSLRRRVVALEEEIAELTRSSAALRDDFRVLHAMYRPFRTAPYSSTAPIIDTVELPPERARKLKV